MENRNKLIYPSVTEVLKPYIDTQWFTEESRDRGTAVHNAITAHLKGLWSKPLSADFQGYFESGLQWIDKMVDRVILVESRLQDTDLSLCGKPDLICTIKGSKKVVLVDWKTAILKSVTWKAQIAAYRHLALIDKGIETHRGLSIRLKANGKMPLVSEYTNFQRDFNNFKSALNAYNAFVKE